jgi:hypothetical protein
MYGAPALPFAEILPTTLRAEVVLLQGGRRLLLDHRGLHIRQQCFALGQRQA